MMVNYLQFYIWNFSWLKDVYHFPGFRLCYWKLFKDFRFFRYKMEALKRLNIKKLNKAIKDNQYSKHVF
jgi:hypothetical protein